MVEWLTPEIAVVLMVSGIVPPILTIYLLYDDWYKPGVLWFQASMALGGVWALCFSAITLIQTPWLILAIGNFFWAIIPAAAVTMFLLSYEYVFKKTASTRLVIGLFAPVIFLFILSWINPADLIYSEEYYVTANGYLHFPPFGAPLKFMVTKVYGYLLAILAAGLLVGEVLRTQGTQRRQSGYLLVIFSALVLSTLFKVSGFVPLYYDPTSTMYSFSGLFFAYSIHQESFLNFIPMARAEAFENVDDPIVITDPEKEIIDMNYRAEAVLGDSQYGVAIDDISILNPSMDDENDEQILQLVDNGTESYYKMSENTVKYGRGKLGHIIVLSDITELKKRQKELDLLKQIYSRVFRHNLRNDVTIINGKAQLIQSRTSGELDKAATTIHQTGTHLLAQTEKARIIANIITQEAQRTMSLSECIENALDEYSDPDSSRIDVSVEDTLIEAHDQISLAFRELIENAIIHNNADLPHVWIESTTRDGFIVLTIRDNGPGIPPNEIEVLEEEQETDLKHSSGLGLWLARWIIKRSNGEMSLETDPEGTQVQVRLQKGTPDA